MIVPILSLWLPIVVSAIVIFFVSFIVHTMLKYHASDYGKLPGEETVLEVLRKLDIPAGEYSLPRPSDMKEMRSTEYKEKVMKGPNAMMTIWPGGPISMGKELALWFIYTIIVGIFSAYIAGRALEPGAPYLSVFRFVGATAFMCYSVALWQDSIWFRRKWSTTIKNTIDGLIYALLTAAIFGWLWP
jgi:hypothetical protein